ncbi:MAG: ribonuclease P protein component [candidate division WOR-3 bacterium]
MWKKGIEPKKKKGAQTSGRLDRESYKKGCRFGLKKNEIIRNKKEIKDLFSNGERFSLKNLVIIYKPDTETKAGFFASGNIKSAVKRNRVKRILREAYRIHKEIFMGLKVIFYAQSLLDAKQVINVFKAFKEERDYEQ